MCFDYDEQGEENKLEGELRNKGVCVLRGGGRKDSNKRAITSPHFKSTGIY